MKFLPIYFVLVLSFLIPSTTAQAQHDRCHTTEKRAAALVAHPEIAAEREKIEQFTQAWINQHKQEAKFNAVLTVPVVVHVVYQNNTQNVSDAQVFSQIDALNRDFRRQNNDFNSTPSSFRSVGADSEIEFCLASVDPNGNPTNGITRTASSSSGSLDGKVHRSNQGGKDGWNPNEYMNIWVCNIGGGILGYAFPPGAGSAAEDGVVIDYNYFGTIGTAQSPFDLGRTGTHEVGHYLNLEHVWGFNGGCNEDDFVNDTPNQSDPNEDCPNNPTSCGSPDMYVNYMDYVDDACMTMFTTGQKNRMLAALNGPRASLLTSKACQTTSLAVELTHFTTTCAGDYVDITWETQWEENHAQFEIQKSENGRSFETFATLKADRSHSRNAQTYEYKDYLPYARGTYYRLKQTDVNGAYRIYEVDYQACTPTSLVKIYPNPMGERLQVQTNFTEAVAALEVRITDLAGRVVYQNTHLDVATGVQINTTNFSAGVYFIHLSTQGQLIYSNKLVK